jgi:hypothetical protein
LAAVLVLVLAAAVGCQAAQPTPTPAAAAARGQVNQSQGGDGQAFALQLPTNLPQDPMAGSGMVHTITGTLVTLGRGRAGLLGADPQATPGPQRQITPPARAQGGGGQGLFQGGGGQQFFQGQGGGQAAGGQRPSGAGRQGTFAGGFAAMGDASEIELTPQTQYLKSGAALRAVTPGIPGTPGARREAPPQPDAVAATVADLQVGSFVMAWGSVIDGRVIADVVYIQDIGR